MQSFDRPTFKVFSACGLFLTAIFSGSRPVFLFFILASPVFLAAQSPLAASASHPPRSDSSQVWLQAMPEADSSFRLRAFFINVKKYPRYLYWRSQAVRGFDKKRDSGDFVALPNDTVLVWQGQFSLEKSDPRSVNFYVIDNDLIVASSEVKFADLRLVFPQKEPEPADLTNSPTGISPEKMDEKPTGLPIFPQKVDEKATETPTDGKISATEPKPAPESPKNNPTDPKNEQTKAPTSQTPNKLNLAKDDFEIDGILTSDVRTNFGRQFYAFFQEKWQAPEKMGGYWISIREILTPGRYTLIAVSLNNRELFRQYLNPNQDYLKDLAGQTADLLTNILKSGDPDGGFTNEDLNGIGVEN